MADAKITITTDGVQAVQDAFKNVVDAVSATGGSFEGLGEKARAVGETLQSAFENPLDAVHNLGGAIGESVLSVLSELGPIGEAVAASLGIFGAAAVALSGTLFELVDHAARGGEAVEAFGLKTGTAVVNIGPLEFAAKAAGGSLDDLTTIVQKMDLKAATDQGGKFSAALQDIGINADAFKQMDSEAQILALGEGFRHGADSGNLMADAIALGGRGMGSNIPLLEKMNDDLLTMGKTMGLAWTPEMLEQSRQFSTDLNILETALGNVGTKIGIALLPSLSSLLDMFTKSPSTIDGIVSAAVGLGETLGVLTIGMGGVAQIFVSGFELVKTAVLGVETGLVGLVAGFANLDAGFEKFLSILPGASAGQKEVAASAAESARQWNAMTSSLASQTAEAAKSVVTQSSLSTTIYQVGDALMNMGTHAETTATAQNTLHTIVDTGKDKVDKYANAWENLASIGDSYLDTVAQIDPKLVEQISYYIEAGAKIGTLAEAYSDVLTPAQVQAIETMVKANDKYAASWTSTQENITKVWDAALSAEDQNNQVGLALEMAKLDTQQQAEADAATKKIADETQLQEMLEAIDAKYDTLRANATTANARKVTTDANALWTEYYNLVDSKAGSATDQQIAKVQEWYDATVAKAIAAGITDTNYYTALATLAQQKMQDVYTANDKYAQDTKKLLADLTDGPGGWVDTFSNILVHSGSFKDAVAGVWQQLKGDTLNVFSDLLAGIIHQFLDELLHQVEVYVAEMLAKLAVLKAVSFLGAIFGFAGGGVVGDPGSAGGARDAQGYAGGGVVYAAGGYFQPSGTDTVPAMLTPGERVLTVQDTQRFERAGGLDALRGGGASTLALEGRIDALHATVKSQNEAHLALVQSLPMRMRHALRGA